MVGLEEDADKNEYILFLDDGRTARVFVNEQGDLEEMVEVIDATSEQRVPYTELSQDAISFVKARTGREFETE